MPDQTTLLADLVCGMLYSATMIASEGKEDVVRMLEQLGFAVLCFLSQCKDNKEKALHRKPWGNSTVTQKLGFAVCRSVGEEEKLSVHLGPLTLKASTQTYFRKSVSSSLKHIICGVSNFFPNWAYSGSVILWLQWFLAFSFIYRFSILLSTILKTSL